MIAFLLKKYFQMSGDKKVRIAFDLSKAARLVRQAGSKTLEGKNKWNPISQNYSK